MNATHLKSILLAGLVSISLAGCLNPPLVKPTKPLLNVEIREDGGMCLTKEDTLKLGTYILELEKH